MRLVERSRRLALAAGLLVSIECAPGRAPGAEVAANSSPSRAASSTAVASAAPLQVWVAAGDAGFEPEQLRASLEHELGRAVVLVGAAPAASVQVRFEGKRHVAVRYTTPSGEELSRRVELPADRERALQVVSWLTVNLVRDEASELLAALRARRQEEVEARAAAARAAAERAAAEKAAADAATSDRAALARAAAEAARASDARAKTAENAAGGTPQKGENEGLIRDTWRSFDLAFFTPASLMPDSRKRALKFQLSVVYGEAGGIEGLSMSAFALRVRRDLHGGAIGLGASILGEDARGVVVSGGYSHVEGSLEGILIGGGAVWQRGASARGLLVGGGGVLASELVGLAVGGGFVSTKALNGAAIAGGMTLIRGPSRGLLLAGGANFSFDHRGLELALGLNTARDLDGFALAPVNIHRHVKGLQIGVVNLAEQVDGAAIGVISLAKDGRLQPVLWSSTDGGVHLAIKSIAGWVFTQIGGGIDLNGNAFSYDGGLGLHFKLFNEVFLEPGVHYSASNDLQNASGAPDEHQLHYLVQAGYRAGDKLDLLGGVGLRHTFSGGAGARFAPEVRAGIAFF